MLSANQKKFVNSLKQKKFRIQHDSFIVEGAKMLNELLQSDYIIEAIFATQNWIDKNSREEAIIISEKELKQISSLKTPNEVLAVVKQKENRSIDFSSQLTIALDQIQDPGNLGAIIRTADWFGISNIICSKDCVDLYNSKVIQATMGSFFRVNVIYKDLAPFIKDNQNLTIYGALLEGEIITKKKINLNGSILLMGNESNGISNDLIPLINERIAIPKFGGAESLNVAVATAIICYESKRC
jgi:TrmH family RNA methyltransferase